MNALYPIDPVPSGPVGREPLGFRPREEQRAALLAELEAVGLELGDYDRRIVDWLAGWEWSTVATITSWVKRAGQGGDAQRADRDTQGASVADQPTEAYPTTTEWIVEAQRRTGKWRRVGGPLTSPDQAQTWITLMRREVPDRPLRIVRREIRTTVEEVAR